MDMTWYRRRGLMVTPHIESVTGAIASFNSDYNKIPIKSLICDIEPIQEGSGDPSPENVRPISGRTGLSVTRAGKNLFNPDSAEIKWVDINGNTIQKVTAKSVTRPTTEGTTWTLSNANISSSTNVLLIAFCDASDIILSRHSIADGKKFITATAPTDTAYVIASFFTWSEASNAQLELGSTATDYEPYKGSTYSVNWETEAGEVYGGTLDVVSGKLTVDRVVATFDGSETWQKSFGYPGSFFRYWDNFNPAGIDSHTFTCSHAVYHPLNDYKYGMCTSDNSCNIFLMTDPNATIGDFKTFLASKYASGNPVQICYNIATPTEIQLTPQEVKTLLVNNIWCDSGNVSVNYWKWGK